MFKLAFLVADCAALGIELTHFVLRTGLVQFTVPLINHLEVPVSLFFIVHVLLPFFRQDIPIVY